MNSLVEVMTLNPPVSDADLTDELVALIDRIRRRGYGQIASEIDEALEGAADHFMDLLAHHLLGEEEILFPALREAVPGDAFLFDALLQEHAYLRREAQFLVDLVRSGEDGGAALARSQFFLTTLYDHIHREAKAVHRAAEKMPWKDVLRLKRRLEAEEQP
jgi:hemerythrin-like domain-containing protein